MILLTMMWSVVALSMIIGSIVPASGGEAMRPADSGEDPGSSIPAAVQVASTQSNPVRSLRPALQLPERDPFLSRTPPPLATKSITSSRPAQTEDASSIEPVRLPPLPFTFLGRVDIAGVTSVFLAENRILLTVVAGDILDNRYMVEQVTATEIVFTHLPSQQRQSLPVW